MSDIQGNLPLGLEEVRKHIGDRSNFAILDNRVEFITLLGWEHLPKLRSEGSSDEIRSKLEGALNDWISRGIITKQSYDQAFGRVPEGIDAYFARAYGESNDRIAGADEVRSKLPQKNERKNILIKENKAKTPYSFMGILREKSESALSDLMKRKKK